MVAVVIALSLRLVLVDDAVLMLRRPVESIEPKGVLAGIDDIMAGAGGHDDREVALDHIGGAVNPDPAMRSEEHTSELQSLMRISYAVFCLKKKKKIIT